MLELTELQLDALKEAFNLGAGRAARALEELIDGRDEIMLDIPNVVQFRLSELEENVRGAAGNVLCGVVEEFKGPFDGSAVLLYSYKESLALVQTMLNIDVPVEELPAMHSEALLEIGNIVLNACLAGMCDMLGEEFITQIPVLRSGSAVDIFTSAGYEVDDMILYLRLNFQLGDGDLDGHIGFSMDAGNESTIVDYLNRYLERAFGT